MMESREERLPLSKRGRRELSAFFAREMLADFARDRLDDDRREALKKYLLQDASARADLDRIRAGATYAAKLSKTTVLPAILERIDEPETYLSVLLKKTNYERWPITVKWGLEAAMVLAIFMTFLVAIPWDRALKFGLSPRGREIVLAEVQHPRTGEFGDADAGFGTAPEVPKVPSEADAPAGPASTVAASAPPSAVPAAPAKTAPTAVPPAAGAKAKATEGSLYRGVLRIPDLSLDANRITEKITELGGRKAGEVELGWRRTNNSVYYHFSMPETKYEALLKFLEDTGDLRIAKEPHPRVMPSGLIRLIITVEETK